MSSCYRPYEGRPGGGLRLYGDDVERPKISTTT